MAKKKQTFRQKLGRIAKLEGGKSQARMGDLMQLQALFFDLCIEDPEFLAHGLLMGAMRKARRISQ